MLIWKRLQASVLVAVLGLSLFAVPAIGNATPTPPESSVATHHLYVIGDSLTYGSAAFGGLRQKLKDSQLWKSNVVDAVVGRTALQGTRIVQKRKFKPNTAILVALGTNDMLSRREKWYPRQVIDEFMKAADGRPVLWLNVEFSTTRRDWRGRGNRFNRQLRLATQRWSNLTIADWDQFFEPNRRSRFVQDGIHLTVSGYRVRNNFMLRSIRGWATSLYNATTITTTTTTVPSPDPAANSTPDQSLE